MKKAGISHGNACFSVYFFYEPSKEEATPVK